MSTDFKKCAENLLNSESGGQVRRKKTEIQELANSPDGMKIKTMLDRNGALSDAVESGDITALKDVLSRVLSTDEGARLAKKLSELMKE